MFRFLAIEWPSLNIESPQNYAYIYVHVIKILFSGREAKAYTIFRLLGK